MKSTASSSQHEANQRSPRSRQCLSIASNSFSPNSMRRRYSMYVMRPHGVSRSRSHWSLGTQSSGVRFWNFTASAPARHAPSTSRRAVSREPLWLIPISAITNTSSPSPTQRPPRRTLGLLMLPPSLAFLRRIETPGADPFRELAQRSLPATFRASVMHALQHLRHRGRGGGGEPLSPDLPQEVEVVHVVADECDLRRGEAARGEDLRQVRELVADALEEVRQRELL